MPNFLLLFALVGNEKALVDTTIYGEGEEVDLNESFKEVDLEDFLIPFLDKLLEKDIAKRLRAQKDIVNEEKIIDEAIRASSASNIRDMVFGTLQPIFRLWFHLNCPNIKDSNLPYNLSPSDLFLSVEIQPKFDGDVFSKDLHLNDTDICVLIFGYFNDQFEMFFQTKGSLYHSDGHFQNILFKKSESGVHFYWADFGRTHEGADSERMRRTKDLFPKQYEDAVAKNFRLLIENYESDQILKLLREIEEEEKKFRKSSESKIDYFLGMKEFVEQLISDTLKEEELMKFRERVAKPTQFLFSALQKKVDDHESDIETLEADIETLEADIENHESDIETLEADIENHESDIETLEADIETNEADIENLEADIENLEADIENLEADIETLEAFKSGIGDCWRENGMDEIHRCMKEMFPSEPF